MTKPSLVVMAAGMGSRYGGLKQIDPIGPNGELIIEYSVYDAIKAGFGKVIFIIKEELYETFKEVIGSRIEKFIDVEYVFQDINNVPQEFNVPQDRVKPWGTGHAVLCCKKIVDTPFAVINADDFYGQTTFKLVHDYLVANKDEYRYAMAGFILENTLTEFGSVARGICEVSEDNSLKSITERTQIKRFDNKVMYTEDSEDWIELDKESIASMNIWGFMPTIFDELDKEFPKFLENSKDNILKAEFYLPSVVDNMIKTNKATVNVLTSHEQWYGVTYKEDKSFVKDSINKLMGDIYPQNLWEDIN